jgi:nickel superoxide dismutase
MKKRSKTISIAAVAVLFVGCAIQGAYAHCQVPCGIYDDTARINAMLEDTSTISKAIQQIKNIAGSHKAADFNQMIRWVSTKEDHASNIIKTVSEYFLTQKVKPVAAGEDGYDAYLKSLADHHAVLRAAMKTKQTVDADAATALEAAIKQLGTHYSN